jgi:hypothetical protein
VGSGSSKDSHGIALKMRLPDDPSEIAAKGQDADHQRSRAEQKALEQVFGKGLPGISPPPNGKSDLWITLYIGRLT